MVIQNVELRVREKACLGGFRNVWRCACAITGLILPGLYKCAPQLRTFVCYTNSYSQRIFKGYQIRSKYENEDKKMNMIDSYFVIKPM